LLEKRYHSVWKGFLVSDPVKKSQRPFMIYDRLNPLKNVPLSSYTTQLQSFMLVDKSGKIRVRDSDKLSSRVVVGEDKEGYIVMVFSGGAISLYNLAEILRDLNINPALGLDGGLQCQLAIEAGDAWEYKWGEYSHNFLGNTRIVNFHPTVPFVLAIEPIKRVNPD
jgi:hypothetical protein